MYIQNFHEYLFLFTSVIVVLGHSLLFFHIPYCISYQAVMEHHLYGLPVKLLLQVFKYLMFMLALNIIRDCHCINRIILKIVCTKFSLLND